MNYSAPIYGASAAASGASATVLKITGIVIMTVLTIFFSLALIAIALGVGLGVGLDRGESITVRSTGTTVATTTVTTACTCGCSSVNISSLSARIINGNQSKLNSWPWMVALFFNQTQFCGGTLVSYTHILTSAQCVYQKNASNILVYAGLYNISGTSQGQNRTVKLTTLHPNYTSNNYSNDIAILTLSSSFNQSTNVGPVCLPSNNTQIPNPGEKALIMGWGSISTQNQVNRSSELREAVVDIQNGSNACANSTTKLCASRTAVGPCVGDEGGPLLTNVNNTWTSTGIIIGRSLCSMNVTEYTRVSAFRAFIDGALVQT